MSNENIGETSWASLIGPVYDAAEITSIHSLIAEDLIVLTTSSGTQVCPVF
jgi:hypothetical protein